MVPKKRIDTEPIGRHHGIAVRNRRSKAILLDKVEIPRRLHTVIKDDPVPVAARIAYNRNLRLVARERHRRRQTYDLRLRTQRQPLRERKRRPDPCETARSLSYNDTVKSIRSDAAGRHEIAHLHGPIAAA